MTQASKSVNFDPSRDISSLEGKVILVTGGTAGLGKISVEALAKHKPAHIYFTGRNATAADTLVAQLKTAVPDVSVSFLPMDLSSLKSIKSSLNNFTHDRLDILMCNGGVFDVPPALSKDGYEIHMATNHLGHAMLIRLLLPILLRTAEISGADVRVVILTSMAYFWHPPGGIRWDEVTQAQDGFWKDKARYAQSKYANLVYAAELARRYPKILSVSVNPGYVATDMVLNAGLFMKIFMTVAYWRTKPPEQGALNQLWAAAGAQRSQIVNGAFYEPVGVIGALTQTAKSQASADKLWAWTSKVLDEHETQ